MENEFRTRLSISASHLDELNALLLDPDSRVINAFLDIVARYGTPEEINRQAREARELAELDGPPARERIRPMWPTWSG